jgi:hypothetical protein
MDKKIMALGGFVIDLTKVSGILKDDNHINHLGKSSTATHYFVIVLDGQRVEIVGQNREDRDELRIKLIKALGWEL